MIAVLMLHMLRVFVMGAFKRPRELTWVGAC
jgi:quinol-cytochrome oxidoreductase complex cytochrome b subunit